MFMEDESIVLVSAANEESVLAVVSAVLAEEVCQGDAVRFVLWLNALTVSMQRWPTQRSKQARCVASHKQ